ncbi:MAG: DUF4232 domain-containing protein [Chloroflexota bacterium]
MKIRYGLAAMLVAFVVVSVGLTVLLTSSNTASVSPVPPPIPHTATTTADADPRPTDISSDVRSKLAAAATIQVPGWSTLNGMYFTLPVPPSWGVPVHSSNDSPDALFGGASRYSTVIESVEWPVTGVEGSFVSVRALYQPYSEVLGGNNHPPLPFQAGELSGVLYTWTYTDIQFTDIEVVLPGTPANAGPICYTALLEMPSTLSQKEQSSIQHQFREAVAQLAPSQNALQNTPTAIPAPSGVAACSATDLQATVDGQGCTGFYCGRITLTNVAGQPCTIRGRPTTKYITHDGDILPDRVSSLPPIYGNPNAEVVLEPGKSASSAIRSSGGSCALSERVPITAAWVMELPGMSGQLPLGEQQTFQACKSGQSLRGIEIGTFQIEK